MSDTCKCVCAGAWTLWYINMDINTSVTFSLNMETHHLTPRTQLLLCLLPIILNKLVDTIPEQLSNMYSQAVTAKLLGCLISFLFQKAS